MAPSQQVSFWSVHEHVQPVLDAVGTWPMVGSPAWCALDGDHPAKLAALLDAAQHHALRVETAQQSLADSSHDVSAAADWPAVARGNLRRARAVASGAYISRRSA
jgi:hypothetical protein